MSMLKDSNALSTNAYVVATNAFPAALTAGEVIGDPGSTFASTYDAVLGTAGGGDGNFSVDDIINPQYLGVRFQLTSGGPTYYAWIGIDITDSSNATGVITQYAYEDSGGSIIAGQIPEPAGLALLALGAPFLLRRKHG
jgi:MYXO-CTERM domain-containing protein